MSAPSDWAVAASVLLDTAARSTVLVGLAWGVTRALPRGSAAQRHAVWACLFGALPLLPALAAQQGAGIAWDAGWLVLVWALGFALALLPLARGLVGLERLRATAVPDPFVPGLYTSDAVPGPITWGLMRPIIVMPAEASTWPASLRAAALAHERAHVARRDWAVHVLAWVVAAGFWFHPLVWLARRELAREAEHAADDRVLASGVRPSDYASLLLALAGAPVARAALGAAPSLVGRRVEAVLGVRSRSALRWPAAAAALALFAVPALGAWPTRTAPDAAELTCNPGLLP